MSRSIRAALRSRSITPATATAHSSKVVAVAESWRNRKTLILSRTDMMGLSDAGRVRRLRRARVPHARSRPRLHGAEGPHRPRPLPGRMGGDAFVHRGAGGGRVQVGLDPRGQREVRAAGRLLDPDLHASGDRFSARDLRRLVPHAHAHRRVGGGVGEVARAQGLEGAGDPRHRQRRPRARSRPATRSSTGRTSASGAGRRRRSTASSRARRRSTRTCELTGTTDVRSRRRGRRRDRHGNACPRLARRRRVGQARCAPRGARRRPEGRAGARSTAPAARRASSSTTSASVARTARSTSPSPKA